MSEPRAPHDELQRLVELRFNAAANLDRQNNALTGMDDEELRMVDTLIRAVDHFDRRIGGDDVRVLREQNQRLVREVAPARQLGPMVDELLAAIQEAGLTADFFTGRWAALIGPINRLDALRERPI